MSTVRNEGESGGKPKPVMVHLLGCAEGLGWALDQDMDNTRAALDLLAGQVQLTNPEQAEVIHAVWDHALDLLDIEVVDRRFVVCHMCTDLGKMLEHPASLRWRERVGLWVTQTREATEAAARIRLPHFYVPYALNTAIFTGEAFTAQTRAAKRQAMGIADNAYLVGNFMRDSLGTSLDRPKPEKGADLFLEIVCGMKARGIPVHVLLAGPRRHWLRQQLAGRDVPFTFLGRVVKGDDAAINVLPLGQIASLYRLLDLCLVSSRHEGGPRAILETAACRIPILSTPVGLAKDVLDSSCLYRAIDEGVDKACTFARGGYSPAIVEANLQRVLAQHGVASVALQFSELYRMIPRLIVQRPTVSAAVLPERPRRNWLRRAAARMTARSRPGSGLRISLWHEFHKPPYGGGNQFMLALQKALRELGTDVVNNRLDASVDVHICNAIWFDPQLERHLADRQPCRIIHRLDGLVHLARSSPDRSADDRAYDFNRRFAAATVLQSDWCLRQAVENGYSPTRPVIIRNASDPAIFSPPRRVQRGPRTRIIATSWSDNPLKGAALYRAMESRIDWTRFEFTYVGRTSVAFDRIRVIPPVPSKRLAELLREHDIYITASRNEACSNALIEALSCGLPALYLNHAGNPEVVGYGGLPFADEIEAEQQLIRLTTSLEGFRNCIHLDSLQATATRYLELAAELMKA